MLRLSVILVSRNLRDWTERAVRSILEQPDPVGTEILIIDPGSTDDTILGLRTQFADAVHSGRLRFLDATHLRLQTRESLRNFGAQAALGNFFCFFEPSDRWARDHLTRLASELSSTDLIFYSEPQYALSQDPIRDLCYQNWLTPSATVIRSTLFDKLGGFRSNPALGEIDLWVRAWAELDAHGARSRVRVIPNRSVILDPHPKVRPPMLEALKPVQHTLSLLTRLPQIPTRYWPDIGKSLLHRGQFLLKQLRKRG